MPANLVVDLGVPLLTETIRINDTLPLGSIIALDPATRIGYLVNANNRANVFGVLRDHNFYPDNLMVVFVSGAFIQDTLKCDSSVTVDALVPRLRELGIFARPSVHYPSEPLPPAAMHISALVPNTALAGSGATLLTVVGSGFASGAGIVFDGTDITTTFVDAGRLTGTITPVAPAGTKSVVVVQGSRASNIANFIVT